MRSWITLIVITGVVLTDKSDGGSVVRGDGKDGTRIYTCIYQTLTICESLSLTSHNA